MTSVLPQLDSLSPDERKLFELLLKKEGLDPSRVPLTRRAPGTHLPLSLAQERLWFLELFDPGGVAYNVPVAFRLSGPLDLECLRRSVREVIERHESLRTSFPEVDGRPIQSVGAEPDFGWTVVDLESLPPEERENEAIRRATEEARRPFDLASGPFVRVSLFRLEADRHLFLLSTHHFVVDGWSLAILFDELAACYAAYSTGKDPRLNALGLQYGDFALWQREHASAGHLEGHLGYWRRQLEGAPAALELPTDRSRPAVWAYEGASRPFGLSRPLTDALDDLCRREGVTLYMLLLAAFQTLLLRYTGQERVIVGTTVSERSRVGTENVVGPFANLLVLHSDLSGDPTFREFLTRVRDVALGAFAHQDLPFERLVEDLRPERDLSRSALVQALFVLHHRTPTQAFALPGVDVSAVPIDLGTARFDVSLDMEKDERGLTGALEYSTALFDPETIERFLAHFQRLLEGIVADPGQPLSALALLTGDEEQKLLHEWNRTDRPLPDSASAHSLFESQVDRSPESVAVESGAQSLTYGELERRANRLARHLRGLGVGPDSLVGICLDRTADLLVAILGVWKAGGAYVPLDPEYPSARLAFMLEDSGAALVITHRRIADRVPAGVRALVLEDAAPEIARASSERLEKLAGSASLAYVIYTSGSTGKPKGVAVPHVAVVNLLSAMRERPGMKPGDRLAAVTSFSFDIALLELMLPLISGARVSVIPREISAGGALLVETLERMRPTVVQATPATWRMILDADWKGDPSLKVLCGGEALTPDLAARLLPLCGELWNMYGPTETTIWSTAARLFPGDSITVGRPIANTQAYVLDARRMPQPIGVPGELWLGGLGLARGYWNRPELTAERFPANPFSHTPDARLFRTGDLARVGPDGAIEVLGRLDNQVKLRGFRIELGEVETLLTQQPGVRQAVAAVCGEDPSDRRLVAYWVARDGAKPTVADLRSALRNQLPDYMVPSLFVELPALPLTPNGKIDRRALPAPTLRGGDGTDQRPPTDSVEVALTKMWERLLKIDHVGVRDNFFELGGHSLLAAQLFVMLEKTFGRKLPLATLFEAPTVEGLAEILRRNDWTPVWSSVVAIQPRGTRPPLYCVHGHGGNVLTFEALARRLGTDQPVYGLQAPGLDGGPPLTSIEALAAHYVKNILAFQPDGPYYIEGMSFGGLVALEMGRLLRAQGKEVGLLALVDTYPPSYKKILRGISSMRHFELRVSEILSWSSAEKRDFLRRRFANLGRGIARRVRPRRARPDVSSEAGTVRALEAVREANTLAAKRYGPAPYDGPVVLYWASDSFSGSSYRFRMGWQTMVPVGLETHIIPGSHSRMFEEPSLGYLAEKLRERLEFAQQARPVARDDSKAHP